MKRQLSVESSTAFGWVYNRKRTKFDYNSLVHHEKPTKAGLMTARSMKSKKNNITMKNGLKTSVLKENKNGTNLYCPNRNNMELLKSYKTNPLRNSLFNSCENFVNKMKKSSSNKSFHNKKNSIKSN